LARALVRGNQPHRAHGRGRRSRRADSCREPS
jgi:hypothetical protein